MCELQELTFRGGRVSQQKTVDVTSQADFIREELAGATEKQAANCSLDVIVALDGGRDGPDNLLLNEGVASHQLLVVFIFGCERLRCLSHGRFLHEP